MKNKLTIALIAVLAGTFFYRLSAQDSRGTTYEYVTIRWGGRDNTHLVRPGGQVEFIGSEIRKFARPDRTDERAFYMNAAINGLAREGYEVVTSAGDDVLMKRVLQ